jgi:hypothetical protein
VGFVDVVAREQLALPGRCRAAVRAHTKI